MAQSDNDSLAKQLLKPLHGLKLDAEYHENTYALAQAKLALDLIQTSVLLHRFNADQTQLDLEPVHVGDVVTSALSSLREYFSEHTIEFDVVFQNSLPAVHADREILEHAVKMLCYGTQMLNINGSVLHLHAHKDTKDNLKLALTAHGLASDKVVLHKKVAQREMVESPLEASRLLFEQVGGVMYKTSHAKVYHGFVVTLPVSRQLALV